MVTLGPIAVEAVRRTAIDIAGEVFATLEGLAGTLVRAVLEAAPTASAVTVRVRKLAVPMDVSMDYAEVELRRER